MSQKTIQYSYRRSKPNPPQVAKIRKQLEGLTGLSINKKIDYIFDGIMDWEHGYNIATITLGFQPDCIETVDDIDYPTKRALMNMKQNMRDYRSSTLCQTLVLYPGRGPNNEGEWRYFNMQKLDEWEIIRKLDKTIVRALTRWIDTVTKILKENAKERNEAAKKKKAEIRYELMLQKRLLRRLEKKNNKEQQLVNISTPTTNTTQEGEGEQQNDETDEK